MYKYKTNFQGRDVPVEEFGAESHTSDTTSVQDGLFQLPNGSKSASQQIHFSDTDLE